MSSRLVFGLTLAAATFVAPTVCLADGDAAAGKRVFNRCMACHDAVAERNKVGPHLVGIVGRPAGAVEDFGKYSGDLKAAAAEGMVWDEENLEEYLRAPKAMFPKGTMAFPGLKSEDDIENVIAYLKADPKP